MVATTLKQREIIIIGYNTDDPATSAGDFISFALLAPIGSGTTIFFTDRSWNGTAFGAAGGGEGTFTFTAATDMAAGSIVTITQAQLLAAGINLSDAGETIYVYQGANANTPSTFLFAADIADGNTTFNGNLTNTGLTAGGPGTTAIAGDNGAYGDRGHNIQTTELLTNVASSTNWTSDNSSTHPTISGVLTNAPDQHIWTALSGDAGLFRLSRDGADTASQQFSVYQSIDTPLTFFNHPNDIVFDTVHGLFFVADSDTGNRRILQGNIADLFNPGSLPTLTVLYTDQSAGTGGGQINGLAIDLNHNSTQGALYFVNQTSLKRVVYDHDGTSPTNQTPTILANLGAGQFANEIALDIASGRAWIVSTASSTEPITVPAGTPGAIFDPDSGTWYIVATNVTNNEIYQIGNLARTDTDATGNTITALDLNGATAGTDLADESGLLQSVDIDATNGHVYFVSGQINNGLNGAVGGVYRYVLGTGAVETLYSETSATDYSFEYIDVDAASGRYYVTNVSFESPGDPNGTSVNTSSIMVHGLSAGAPTEFAQTPDMNSAGPLGLSIQNAPTLSGTAIAALGVTEASSALGSGNTSSVTLYSGLTASDIDTLNGTDELAGAQVRISTNFQSGATHQDHLRIGGNLSGSATGITWSYNSTTGVMTFTGPATVAEYVALLNQVTFNTSGDDPTAYGSANNRQISVSVFDGLLYSDEIHNTVTVTGINDAPVNTVPGAQTFAEDTARVFSAALANALSTSDVDADPAAQSLRVTLSVGQGTLTLTSLTGLSFVTGDGTGDTTMTFTGTAAAINAALGAGLAYNPNADYNGTDTLTFTVNDQGLNGTDPGSSGDGSSEQATSTVTLNISAVVDIANDSGTTTEDNAVNVNVLANDTFEATNETITGVTQGSNGTVTINNNGTAGNPLDDFVVYTPNADFNGTDSFTYTVTSGGVTETATVNVTIGAVVDIANDSATTNEDTPVNILVFANDTFEATNEAITGVTQGANGTVTVNNNGTAGDTTDDFIVYTANADFNGTDSFTYTVTSGGVTETATVNVTINAVVDIANDTTTTDEGIAKNVMVLANDTFEGTPSITGFSQGANGTVTLNNNGTAGNTADDYLVYTPTGDTNGPDSFTYTVTSGGVTETATVNITVNPINDAPINTVGATVVTTEDSVNVALTGMSVSDVDAGSAPITVILAVGHGVLNVSTSVVGGLTAGQVTDNGTGSITIIASQAEINTTFAAMGGVTYTPTTNFNVTETLTVTTNDGGATGADAALEDVDTRTITVNAVNDAPTVIGDGTEQAVDIVEDTPHPTGQTVSSLFSGQYSDAADAQFHMINNPSGSSPGAFSGVAVVANGSSGATGQWQYFNSTTMAWVDVGSVAANNALLIGSGTSIRFNPATGFIGTAPTLTVHLIDNSLGFGITFGQHVDISAMGATGGTTAYSTGQVVLSQEVEAGNEAPVVDLNDGTMGLDDTNLFAEGTSGSGIGTSISVTDADPGDMIEGATITITDGIAGDSLFATLPLPGGITVDPASTATTLILTGSASAADYEAALGQIGYVHTGDNPTVDGTDTTRSITVVVTDGDDDSAAATMTMTISGTNDAAVITGDATGSVTEAGGVANGTAGVATDTGDLDSTDVDGPEDAWTAVSAGASTDNGYGTYALSATGVWTYTLDDSNAAVQALNGAATLTDTFTAVTTDGASQLVTITINAQNDAAVATGDTTGDVTEAGGVANGTAGTPTDTGNLDHTDIDNDDDVWQVTAAGTLSSGGYGTYGVAADGAWTYTLDDSNAAVQALNGAATLVDTIVATAEDGTLVTVTITIHAQNDNATTGGGTTGDVTEAGGVANGTLGIPTDSDDLSATDPDNTADSWTAVAAGATSANGYGTYELAADGTWTYTLDDADPTVQALNGAATLTDSFTAVTEDGTTQVVTITIHAQNDAAVVTGDTTGSVTEAGGANNGTPGTSPETGDLDHTDVDNTNDVWQVVAAGQLSIGGYGTYGINAAGVWTYTVDENHAAVQGLAAAATLIDTFAVLTEDGTSQTVTVTITGADDAAIAHDDNVTTDEASTLAGNVLDNNGVHADEDIDGGMPLSVIAVNGSAVAVGTEITLASGAKLTLNANGTFSYNPNGSFNPTPTPGSGASNQPATDSFTYTLVGGDSATVTVTINGLDTNDLLLGTAAVDTLTAGVGHDTLNGLASSDYMYGGAGNDVYHVDSAGDRVFELSGEGFDRVIASTDFTIYAGESVERLETSNPTGTAALALGGNEFNNIIVGNDGNNILYGKLGFDVLDGRAGDDFYLVDDAGEFIIEAMDGGTDRVFASMDYTLYAGSHVEIISTAAVASTTNIALGGNELANTIIGNAGDNILYGKEGADILVGHGGNDTFFITTLGAGDIDTIMDFQAGDKIGLSHAVFTTLSHGALPAGYFQNAGEALDPDDRILYDQDTGALYYDADGSGAGDAVQFATVVGSPALTFNDFTVI